MKYPPVYSGYTCRYSALPYIIKSYLIFVVIFSQYSVSAFKIFIRNVVYHNKFNMHQIEFMNSFCFDTQYYRNEQRSIFCRFNTQCRAIITFSK